MARSRTPTNVLKLRGADRKHPERMRERTDEPKTTAPLGDPPAGWPEEVTACWHEIADLAHAGTLTKADRVVVEELAHVLALVRSRNWQVDPKFLVRIETCLGKLGMTPADRSKVSAAPADRGKANPLDEFAA